ncbi:MAG: HD domain-containing protein, partial [Nitrospirae bacterium]|nr:HD domain-containing protein [Nitrospirota bacterium]
MIKQPQASLFDLVMCLSEAIDLVDLTLAGHHKKVAYIGSCLGAEMKLLLSQQTNLILAGALHDIGALSLSERMNTLRFDFQDKSNLHAELGERLLATFPPFVKLLPIVRYHHVYFKK